jgi:hypothetical protein
VESSKENKYKGFRVEYKSEIMNDKMPEIFLLSLKLLRNCALPECLTLKVKRGVSANYITLFCGEKRSNSTYSMISIKTRAFITQCNVALFTAIYCITPLKVSLLIS